MSTRIPESLSDSPAGQSRALFRREALDYRASRQRDARLLALGAGWTHWVYWVLVAATAFGLCYMVVGRVQEYAVGAAFVRADGRVDVNARTSGLVEEVAVYPGQRVGAGEALVKLYSHAERAELARVDHEFEAALIEMLRQPGARTSERVAGLRAQRELAAARLEERVLRAPEDGVVADVRVRPGQEIVPGDFVLSLMDEGAGFRVVALLPGQYRPLLEPGMHLRLELGGFRYAYQDMIIESVGDEVVGPAEIRRYLGHTSGDVLDLYGALVIVHARLPEATFKANGRGLAYYEGMQGEVAVAVRSEPLIVMLLPGLKAILGESVGGQP